MTTTHSLISTGLILLAVGAHSLLAQSDSTPPAEAPWAYGVQDHPAVLLHTDQYVYVKGQRSDNRFVMGIIDPNKFEEPVTLFLYWQDRTSGKRRFYNFESGFSAKPIDLYTQNDELAPAILRKPFNGLLLNEESLRRHGKELDQGVGHYLWCFEIRDAQGRKTLSRAYALYSIVREIIEVEGTLPGNTDWSAEAAYRLNGRVVVPDGATLTIEPGCFVFGAVDQLSLLNVEVGGRLVADGSPLFPIVFTSDLPLFQRRRSDWGGVVINGDAPVNEPNAMGEGNTGRYGGDNPHHDGGILRYVRVEFSGRRFSPTDELNGLTFQGCGDGTIIDHVQVHQCSDDGIEFFGGTANARHVLVSGCGDDSLDLTYGYQGKLQNLVFMQLYNEADRGIEADNHPDDSNAEPRTAPQIYNATFLGLAALSRDAAQPSDAIYLSHGAGIDIHNSIFWGFGGRPIAIESEESKELFRTGNSAIQNCIFSYNHLLSEEIEQQADLVKVIYDPDSRNRFGKDTKSFTSITWIKPNPTPLNGAYAAQPESLSSPPDDGFFQPVSYIGGIDTRDPDGPWIFAPWTNFVLR